MNTELAELDGHARDLAECTGWGYERCMVNLQQLTQLGLQAAEAVRLLETTHTFTQELPRIMETFMDAIRHTAAVMASLTEQLDSDARRAGVCRRGHGELIGGRCRKCDR